MDLLVDLGNSRMKWALSAPEVWRAGAVPLDHFTGSLLDATWGKIEKPSRAVVCSVSAPERLTQLKQWMQRRWSVVPHVVHSQKEQLGVKNYYRQPELLGADRWVALIGARGLTERAACVVDAGTAVTVDALSAAGEFRGGVIFPGLGLLRDSLAQGTEAISALTGNANDCLARSTADGVAAGTLFGLAGAVERVIEEQRRIVGPSLEVFLTGGDAPVLGEHLRVALTPVPELVLQGLARIANHL